MNRAPRLYQLQSQWDEERAQARFAPFLADIRAAARRDLRSLPWLFTLGIVGVTGLAAISRAFA